MAVVWTLKKWLAVERDIYRASQLQALLAKKAGVQLSLQAISVLINGEPQALRLQTIQALCTALDCKLSDFCDVLPDTVTERRKKKASGDTPSKLYGGRPASKEPDSIFPDPRNFGSKNKPAK